MPKSVFYYHKCQLDAKDKYSDLKQRIIELYHKHKGRYGYRRITIALKQLGYHHNHKHNHKLIAKLMKQLKLNAKIRRKKYRSYKGQQGKIAKNRLRRRFRAGKPNKRWLTDITEFKVGDNKLYLSPILDCYNNEIVSYTLSKRPTYDLVSKMLDYALDKTKTTRHKKLMLHSDQGWHYQMRPFRKTLKKNNVKQSMSRRRFILRNPKRLIS